MERQGVGLERGRSRGRFDALVHPPQIGERIGRAQMRGRAVRVRHYTSLIARERRLRIAALFTCTRALELCDEVVSCGAACSSGAWRSLSWPLRAENLTEQLSQHQAGERR